MQRQIRCYTQMFLTLTVNIDSLARFKAKKEAGNFCQILSNIAIQKLNYHILSQITKKRQ